MMRPPGTTSRTSSGAVAAVVVASYPSPRETTNFTTDSFPGVTRARSPRSANSFTFDEEGNIFEEDVLPVCSF